MGPTIVFDKSAIQSIGQKSLIEVGLHFFTVVPPVLLFETLADLSLNPNDLASSKKKVAEVANKVFPSSSIANEHYYTMCKHNLLGDCVPMERRPAITGSKHVVAADGSKGVVIDKQREYEAVSRWRNGMFSREDMAFATSWRQAATGANLEELKQLLPRPSSDLKSAENVRDFVDGILSRPDAQEPLLVLFLYLMKFDPEITQKILVRWKFDVSRSLVTFAPYACHCLRVQLIFYFGMQYGIFGTRSSNIVDLEYLHYIPFASVFCSGDKLHSLLAPIILAEDQSFVPSIEMNKALKELATQRDSKPDVDPPKDSLIHTLWLKHLNKEPKRFTNRTLSKHQIDTLMRSIQPIVDAISQDDSRHDQRARFPV